MKKSMLTLLMGVWFGVILVKSQVVSWQYINDMFHFRSAYMYLVIASAVMVGALSVFIIRRVQAHTIDGEPIVIQKKPFHKGVVFGSTILAWGGPLVAPVPDQFTPKWAPVHY